MFINYSNIGSSTAENTNLKMFVEKYIDITKVDIKITSDISVNGQFKDKDPYAAKLAENNIEKFKKLDWVNQLSDYVEDPYSLFTKLYFTDYQDVSKEDTYRTLIIKLCSCEFLEDKFIEELKGLFPKNFILEEHTKNYQILKLKVSDTLTFYYVISPNTFTSTKTWQKIISEVLCKYLFKTELKDLFNDSPFTFEEILHAQATRISQTLVKTYDATLQNIDCNLANYLESYRAWLVKRENHVKTKPDVDIYNKKLTEVLSKYHSKGILDLEYYDNDSYMIIKITTTIHNYNEKSAQRLLESYSESSIRAKILKNIFVDNKYSILVNQPYVYDVTHCGIRAKYKSFKKTYINDIMREEKVPYIINPHIYYHECFGQNGPILLDLLSQYNFEGFINCLISTTGNLNFSDTVVMREFWERIIDKLPESTLFCVKNETGEQLTFKQFKDEVYNDENN